MSDVPQGPNWWQATDDKWYPPETHPDFVAPAPPAAEPVGDESVGNRFNPEPSIASDVPRRPTEPDASGASPLGDPPPSTPATPTGGLPPLSTSDISASPPPEQRDPAVPPTLAGGSPTSETSSSKRLGVLLGVLLATVLIGAAVIWFTSRDTESSDPPPTTSDVTVSTADASGVSTTDPGDAASSSAPSSTEAATTTAAPLEVPAVPTTIVCNSTLGWTVQLAWPGELAGLSSYRIEGVISELVVFQAEWFNEASSGGAAYGLAPGSTVLLSTTAIGASGETLGVENSEVVIPDRAC